MDDKGAIAYLKVLTDETRLRMLGLLAEGELSVNQLGEMLEIRQQDVLRHLTMLVEFRLVTLRKAEGGQLFRLDIAKLHALNKALAEPANLMPEAQGDDWRSRVFRAFFEGDQLKELPVPTKKRMVILEWFLQKFDRGVRYTEQQVNDTITRHFADYATLRRELINEGLMTRENGMYWRTESPAATL